MKETPSIFIELPEFGVGVVEKANNEVGGQKERGRDQFDRRKLLEGETNGWLRLVAMIERPSPRSLGMVAFACAEACDLVLPNNPPEGGSPHFKTIGPDTTVTIYGYAKGVDVRTGLHFMRSIFDTHQSIAEQYPSSLYPLEHHNIIMPQAVAASGDIVLGWIGEKFVLQVEETEGAPPLPPPPCLGDNSIFHLSDRQGRIWIGTKKDVYGFLENWVKEAFKSILKFNLDDDLNDRQKGYKIARLMAWCLPDDIRTRAALYFTSDTMEKAARELKWAARCQESRVTNIPGESLQEKVNRVSDELLVQFLEVRRIILSEIASETNL